MRFLTAKFDVTGLTEAEIDALTLAVAVQAESDGAYPSVDEPAITVDPAPADVADVSSRLREMLAVADRAEAAGVRPESIQAARETTAASLDGTTNFGGIGRGPTGRLRNCRQMNDGKLFRRHRVARRRAAVRPRGLRGRERGMERAPLKCPPIRTCPHKSDQGVTIFARKTKRRKDTRRGGTWAQAQRGEPLMATAVLFLVAFVVLTFAGGGATLFRWGRFRIGAARRLP